LGDVLKKSTVLLMIKKGEMQARFTPDEKTDLDR
jgi:hypothetical protein